MDKNHSSDFCSSSLEPADLSPMRNTSTEMDSPREPQDFPLHSTTTTSTTATPEDPLENEAWKGNVRGIRRSITQADIRPKRLFFSDTEKPLSKSEPHHASFDPTSLKRDIPDDWLFDVAKEKHYSNSLSRRMLDRSSNWLRQFASSPRRNYRRVMFKNGDRNLSCVNIPKRGRRYVADMFTTLVDSRWRVILSVFVGAFTLSWICFAVIWHILLLLHGDYDNYNAPDWKPCVVNVDCFASVLLFSIETQHTIGYGYRYTNTVCPHAIGLMMIQSCFGVIVQALMSGLVFAKLSRPKKRAQTLMFSRNAVICKRDGQLVLLLRVGDMRKSHVIQTQIRGFLLKRRITSEGEVLSMEEYPVDFGCSDNRDRLFLAWPTTVSHNIDSSSSPFWEMSADDLKLHQFELVIILEGIIQSTGMTTQARTSYLPSEILWGHKFKKLVTYERQNGQYQIDFEHFHDTEEIKNFPTRSAKALLEWRQMQSCFHGNEQEEEQLFPPEDGQSLVSPMMSPSSAEDSAITFTVKNNGYRDSEAAEEEHSTPARIRRPIFRRCLDFVGP